MEYPESTMETLVFDILICWKWLGTNRYYDFNAILTYTAMDGKMQFAMSEIKGTQPNLPKSASFVYIIFT